MSKHLVLLAGNIAAGKTSLTERLGPRLGWRTGFESVADNPYLADFYADMRQWSFHLQIFFLGHRAQQFLDLARGPESVIVDRSIGGVDSQETPVGAAIEIVAQIDDVPVACRIDVGVGVFRRIVLGHNGCPGSGARIVSFRSGIVCP